MDVAFVDGFQESRDDRVSEGGMHEGDNVLGLRGGRKERRACGVCEVVDAALGSW